MIFPIPKTLHWLFRLAWLFVILVSVFDGYLVWHNREVISEFEQNPAGRALLGMADGGIWILLSIKSLGTVLASMWLLLIYRKSASIGIVIALSLAGFQFGLLIYLYYA